MKKSLLNMAKGHHKLMAGLLQFNAEKFFHFENFARNQLSDELYLKFCFLYVCAAA